MLPLLVISFLCLEPLSVWLKLHGSPELWILMMSVKGQVPFPPPQHTQIVFFVILAAMIGCFWQFFRIKRVRLDEKNHYVSNYFQEITIPLTNLEDVRQNGWPEFDERNARKCVA